jgi:glycosyltransferase involved in cell wall biosynthesis
VTPDSTGPGAEAYSIAERLYSDGTLYRVVCPDFDADSEGLPTKTFVTPPGRLFYRLLKKVLRMICRFLNVNDRRLQEQLFDFFVGRSAALRKSDAILFLKPGFPYTAKRLQAARKPVVGWASVFHPEFNYRQVRKEERRYGLTGHSSYTDQKRTENLTRFFNQTDHLLVQSELAHKIYQDYGIPAENLVRLKKIAFGVDCDKYVPAPGGKTQAQFRALHISHMSLIKGIGYLLEAWEKLGHADAELRLGGSADADVDHLANIHASPSIVRLGPIKNTVPEYQLADVFVSPSVSDANPSTILEAMACGTPVISSNMCGRSELISHGVDGFVYNYDDPDELGAHLRWCYENRDRLFSMGQAARKKALDYRQTDFAGHICAAIYDIMNSYDISRP